MGWSGIPFYQTILRIILQCALQTLLHFTTAILMRTTKPIIVFLRSLRVDQSTLKLKLAGM